MLITHEKKIAPPITSCEGRFVTAVKQNDKCRLSMYTINTMESALYSFYSPVSYHKTLLQSLTR